MSENSTKVTRTAETNTKADAVLTMFDQISNDVLLSVQAKIDRRVAQKVKKLEDAIDKARPIQIMMGDQLVGKPIEGIVHQSFELLLHVVATGVPVMLVGAAGTGKSHSAELVAQSFDLPFYAMSVGAQTSKSDLIGYMNAVSAYVRTVFREAYENGGVFLLDEIDAGNSNVLIQLNAALANGYMSFPDGMVRKHDDFKFIASANTFGLGASRQYVGRNQLDAATLDRFTVLTWDIDNQLEESLAVGEMGAEWLKVVRFVRNHVTENELRIVVSPRATQRGSLLLQSGIDFNNTLHMALLSQFTGETKQEMHKQCHQLWRELLKEMKARHQKEIDDAEGGPAVGVIVPNDYPEANVTLDELAVRQKYPWITELENGGYNSYGRYNLLFGSQWPLACDADSKRDVAKIIVESCNDYAKFEMLKVLLPGYGDSTDSFGYDDPELRRAVFQRLASKDEWDFMPELIKWLARDKPSVELYAG